MRRAKILTGSDRILPPTSRVVASADIVRRLRAGTPCCETEGRPCPDRSARAGCTCTIAADEIEKLRAALIEIERLTSEIDEWGHGHRMRCNDFARNALW